MSLTSKKRRKARRGGVLGMLGRLSERLKPTELPANATPEQRFADAVVRGWHVYAHPEMVAELRAAGVDALACSYMARGKAVAMKPSPLLAPFAPWSPLSTR